jgi:hypothetical protein
MTRTCPAIAMALLVLVGASCTIGAADGARPRGSSRPATPPCVWREVATPQGRQGFENTLLAVTAPSTDAAWAIGDYFTGSEAGRHGSFIERWDGHRWTVVTGAVPKGGMLWDIASDSAGDVWAVGAGRDGNQALVTHWDGTRWRSLLLPVRFGYSHLRGVAARATNDVWAVGDRGTQAGSRTLTVHWDGARWRILPSPSPPPRPLTGRAYALLESVAAVARDDVWAVGSTSNVAPVGVSETLIEHWDGSRWRRVPSPNQLNTAGNAYNLLFAVAVAGPDDVWAAGSWNSRLPGYGGGGDNPLAEHWDGRMWRITPMRTPTDRAILYQLVTTPQGAVAVGDQGNPYRTLIERRAGRRWSTGASQVGSLAGLALDAGGLWAVGARGGRTLALRCAPVIAGS